MSPDTVEILFQDLRAARAFIDRAECKLRRLLAESKNGCRSDAQKRLSEPSEDDGRENTRLSPSDAPQTRSSHDSCNDPVLQDELFAEFCQKAASKAQKSAPPAKKGAPKLTRQQVLSNFRQFAKGKDLLDLSTVNRIFGYAETTSGSFIRHAVKRGELGMIPVGRQNRFLASEVRSFIKSYFDSVQQ